MQNGLRLQSHFYLGINLVRTQHNFDNILTSYSCRQKHAAKSHEYNINYIVMKKQKVEVLIHFPSNHA